MPQLTLALSGKETDFRQRRSTAWPRVHSYPLPRANDDIAQGVLSTHVEFNVDDEALIKMCDAHFLASSLPESTLSSSAIFPAAETVAWVRAPSTSEAEPTRIQQTCLKVPSSTLKSYKVLWRLLTC